MSADQAAVVSKTRGAIVDELLARRDDKRQRVLSLAAFGKLFAWPVFSQAAIEKVIASIIAICNEWSWL
jgi:hypothetical protein